MANSVCCAVELDLQKARADYDEQLRAAERLRSTANYLSAAMLYLKDNALLREPLSRAHLKSRLLGHWGTDPGLNLFYAHLNLLLLRHSDADLLLVVGPGHGAPAILANQFLEGSLGRFYPRLSRDASGVAHLVRQFAWPGGFPTHANAELPGMIYEGGELGYSLAVSFGAVFDNPDLVAVCVVGDGEAETGPMATAWHATKYLDPAESGAVLPIVHINGFKISSSTIYGRMSNNELLHLFTGYGYAVRFVGAPSCDPKSLDSVDVDADMTASLEWAYSEIRAIQADARAGRPRDRPRWPVLLVRTPKGWTGPKQLHGKPVEGTWRSHGLPLPDPLHDDEAWATLQHWLHSYEPATLFDAASGVPRPEVLAAVPPLERSLGMNRHARTALRPLRLPPLEPFAVPTQQTVVSPMQALAPFLSALVEANRSTFRIFSPDELDSNKLAPVLRVTTRNFQWDSETAHRGGRVLETLSEHQCMGWLHGYSLTGRWGLFPSYETFLGIVSTMVVQYEKFLKKCEETPQLHFPVPGITFIESSTLWRQEHNGYSHQDPMFLSVLANLKGHLVRAYLPPDANTLLCVMERCFRDTNKVNLVVATKSPQPSFLSLDDARRHVDAGVSVWPFASTDGGREPDVVIVGCGDETNYEALKAAELLRTDLPELRVRFVNVCDLFVLDIARRPKSRALDELEFEAVFTADRPVVFCFHGYPQLIWQLLRQREGTLGRRRVVVHGYMEEGATTTPFKMLVMNQCSRFHIAMDALKLTCQHNPSVAVRAMSLVGKYERLLRDFEQFILETGCDPDDLGALTATKHQPVRKEASAPA